jgi:hypothetical protein
MAAEDSLRINRDLAIYFDGGLAKFRPPYRDPEKVFQSVLRWEEENKDHPRRLFVQEWIQSFELPERQLSSLRGESAVAEALSRAKSFRQMKNIIAEHKMKSGMPEPQARAEAASEIDALLDSARKQLRERSPSDALP